MSDAREERTIDLARAAGAVVELHEPLTMPDTQDWAGNVCTPGYVYCGHCDTLWPCTTITVMSQAINTTSEEKAMNEHVGYTLRRLRDIGDDDLAAQLEASLANPVTDEPGEHVIIQDSIGVLWVKHAGKWFQHLAVIGRDFQAINDTFGPLRFATRQFQGTLESSDAGPRMVRDSAGAGARWVRTHEPGMWRRADRKGAQVSYDYLESHAGPLVPIDPPQYEVGDFPADEPSLGTVVQDQNGRYWRRKHYGWTDDGHTPFTWQALTVNRELKIVTP